ncbi:predicted protein [Nematostella vectensis]|uniref:RING-type domain-containing protein n=1 Tax=Nematostella vectensis TaxID=45351 RepID=A7RK42_NEMVE|nr:tripartite motif-containing protein 2 [Nematostella vectensis]EDO48099.1 predicted protein [Nematostella vectensis]|eukprot:XP_001640162.1 predicted protein [Nematostella vectensis]
MAFFKKIPSKSDELSGSNSLVCPICEEEYDDPKRLPCMHTICLGCLESMVPKNALIMKCPIDEQELPMPMGGINALPSDLRIVRLLEVASGGQTKSKKKRRSLSAKSLENNEKQSHRAVHGKEAISLEEEATQVKKLISETAEKIRDALTTKENEMLKKVDEIVKRQLKKRASIASVSSISEDDEAWPDSPTDGDVFDDEKKENTSPKSKTKPPPVPPKRPPSFLIDLTPSRKILQMVREEGLGNLQFGRKMSAPGDAGPPAPLAHATPSFGGAAEVIDCINLPNRFKRNFGPTAVAVSPKGHVAVSDYGSECVLLFDEEWNFVRKIGEGDCNEAGLEGPDGLAFLPDSTLIVSDAPLEGVQAIKLYKPSGEYKETIVELDTDAMGDDALYFGRLTTDANSRIILACSGTEPCIRVYSRTGELELEFGAGILNGPQKALFHDNKYFVSDSLIGRHKCNIKMFDKEGKYVKQFDDNKLHVGEQDSLGLDITYPIQIAVDPHTNTLLAYHGLDKCIRIYKTDGSFVIGFRTVTGIRDIAVNKDSTVVASCGEESMLPRSVQILKYL